MMSDKSHQINAYKHMAYLEGNVVKIGEFFDLDSVRHVNANIFNAINSVLSQTYNSL